MKLQIGISLLLMAAISGTSVFSQPRINTEVFPYSGGWLGGDAAYSIPLDATTTIWLFGDTFVGNHRAESTMIHNSVAIRKCQTACEVTYWWSGIHSKTADAFFKTPESNYFWPLDGFMHAGHLYVFLEEMHATSAGGAFGFDYSSIQLVTVSNPRDDPDRWTMTFTNVSKGNRVVPGIAVAVHAGSDQKYANVFALFRGPPTKPFVGLLRFPLNDLDARPNKFHWQYLSKNGSRWLAWPPSTSPPDAWKAFDGNVTEMSIKYHPDARGWIAVFPTPGLLSKTASYAYSRDITGPWREPQAFFEYPEMKIGNAQHTSNVFCYAAKEHPEMEAAGDFAFTYACNSLKETEIFSDMQLYRPELVTGAFPVGLRLEPASAHPKQ